MTGTAWSRWHEVADGVLVRRHRALDVNAGLVVGTERCLVVDTRSSDVEGRDLLAAVREVTRLPHVVLNTHAHFDHCFGNAVFAAAARPAPEIWAHARCRDELLLRGAEQRAAAAAWLRQSGDDELADDVEQATVVPPDRTLGAEPVTLPLGGRDVVLRHLGRGHTDHDVVVQVVGAGVTFAGDLVEQGAPPAFEDAFPLEWPGTVDAVLGLPGDVVVPGHGDVVDRAFVAAQRADLVEVAEAARELPADADDPVLERVANRLAVGGPAGFVALRRALGQLAGPPSG